MADTTFDLSDSDMQALAHDVATQPRGCHSQIEIEYHRFGRRRLRDRRAGRAWPWSVDYTRLPKPDRRRCLTTQQRCLAQKTMLAVGIFPQAAGVGGRADDVQPARMRSIIGYAMARRSCDEGSALPLLTSLGKTDRAASRLAIPNSGGNR
jgi:hypothetical protein